MVAKEAAQGSEAAVDRCRPTRKGLHSSTSQLNVGTFCGIRWVLSVDTWVITRHKLDTKRLSDQNGLA